MDKLAEDFMSKFRGRIAHPQSLLDFVNSLTLEQSLSILKELNLNIANYPEIQHEASSFLCSMVVVKYAGLPIMEKKSLWQRIFQRKRSK